MSVCSSIRQCVCWPFCVIVQLCSGIWGCMQVCCDASAGCFPAKELQPQLRLVKPREASAKRAPQARAGFPAQQHTGCSSTSASAIWRPGCLTSACVYSAVLRPSWCGAFVKRLQPSPSMPSDLLAVLEMYALLRGEVCRSQLHTTDAEGKKMLISVLCGGSPPSTHVGNEFVAKLQKVSIYLRWLAISLLPSEYSYFLSKQSGKKT